MNNLDLENDASSITRQASRFERSVNKKFPLNDQTKFEIHLTNVRLYYLQIQLQQKYVNEFQIDRCAE